MFESSMPDPQRERRIELIKRIVGALLLATVVIGGLAWWLRYYAEEHTVDKFFTSIEQKKFEDAFAIWNADPDWRQHADKYKDYPYGQFELDWGPTGEYGEIKSHKVEGAV